MQHMRLDSKDGLANGWSGVGASVGDARNPPDRARAHATAETRGGVETGDAPKRGWIRAVLTFARNAIVGVLLVSALPVAMVELRSKALFYFSVESSLQRLEFVDRLRPLMAPKDASITPMQAGLALHALQPAESKPNPDFPTVPAMGWTEWPWRKLKVTPDMFVQTSAATRVPNGPSPDHVIQNAADGFTPKELAYLREIAEAPVWKNYDLVAAAPSVDVVGGQYQLPFSENAFLPDIRTLRFSGTKELAYASHSRAAYYLATGEPAKAEAAMRSTVSFGFALIDNATTTIDALLGAIVVNIGRAGLEQFSIATHGSNPLAQGVALPTDSKSGRAGWGKRLKTDELHSRLLSDVSNEKLARGVRMEQLNQLSMASCTNIPEMIFGPGEATREAFANAHRTLARYPSDHALLDLMLDETNRVPEKDAIMFAPERLLMGAAAVASTVTGNSRFSTCARIAASYW